MGLGLDPNQQWTKMLNETGVIRLLPDVSDNATQNASCMFTTSHTMPLNPEVDLSGHTTQNASCMFRTSNTMPLKLCTLT